MKNLTTFTFIYEDGKKWFVENFPDGKKVKEDDKFDVIIIEEFLAEYRKEFPEYDIPYDKVVSSLFNGLDTRLFMTLNQILLQILLMRVLQSAKN